MNFSVTEQGTFERCERQAVLTSKNGQHIGQIFPPLSLSLGSLMHRTHQLWATAPDPTTKSLSEYCMDASVEMTEHAKTRYKLQVGCLPSDGEMSDLYEAVDFGMAMSELYQTRWGQPLPDDYKLLSAEQKIEIPVSGTEHECEKCGGTGRMTVVALDGPDNFKEEVRLLENCDACEDSSGTALHKLEGRLDGLTQRVSTGRILILERKTYNSRPKQDALAKNYQFLSYDWMVRSLKISELPVGTLYDGQWRRKEIPRDKRFEDLFDRWILDPRSQAERDEFERMLPIRLNKMYALYREPERATINRRWQGCYDCGVEDLCWAMSNKRSTQLLMQTKYTTRTDDIDLVEEPSE